MPPNAKGIWTPRGTTARHHTSKKIRRRTFTPHLARTEPWAAPKPVPIKGAFAGLTPRHKAVRGDNNTSGLTAKADAWDAEADEILAELPEMSVKEQIASNLASCNVAPLTLCSQWDPSGSGSCVKMEFRLRLKGFMATRDLEPPAPHLLDEIFDEYDKDHSGIVEFAELVAAIKHLQQTGVRFNKTRGATVASITARADARRERATLARDAAAAESSADRFEGELLHARAKARENVEVQLGLTLARRRIGVGDIVGKHATSVQGMSKADHRELVRSMGIQASAAEMDACFDKLDDDGSGHMDVKEATAALKLLQARGAEASAELDRMARKSANARRRGANKVKQLMSLPPFPDAVSANALKAIPEEMLATPESTSKNGLILAVNGMRALGDSIGGAVSDRIGGAVSARQQRRLDKEREKRVKVIAAQAMMRLSKRELIKSWNTWADWHAQRTWRLGLVGGALKRLAHRQLVMGLEKWSVFYQQKARMQQVMRGALVKLIRRRVARGMAGWTDWWEVKIEENRLMAIAARSSASMRNPHMVAMWDEWKQQASISITLGARRHRPHGFGFVSNAAIHIKCDDWGTNVCEKLKQCISHRT